jgi:Na+/phosphate symporter
MTVMMVDTVTVIMSAVVTAMTKAEGHNWRRDVNGRTINHWRRCVNGLRRRSIDSRRRTISRRVSGRRIRRRYDRRHWQRQSDAKRDVASSTGARRRDC